MLTQKKLKKLLHYNQDTGEFTWRVNRGGNRSGTVAGSMNGSGYILIQIDGKSYKAHRLAWLYEHGAWPPADMDHINHIRTDNRLDNLRPVTRSENMRNASKYSHNSSGVTGVHWHKDCKKWRAFISVDGKQLHLRLFDCSFDALVTRLLAEQKYGYHKNHGQG